MLAKFLSQNEQLVAALFSYKENGGELMLLVDRKKYTVLSKETNLSIGKPIGSQ